MNDGRIAGYIAEANNEFEQMMAELEEYGYPQSEESHKQSSHKR